MTVNIRHRSRERNLQPTAWVDSYYAGWYWDQAVTKAAARARIDHTCMTHLVLGRWRPGPQTVSGVVFPAGTLAPGSGTFHSPTSNPGGGAGCQDVEGGMIIDCHAVNNKAIMMIGGAGDINGYLASTATPQLIQSFAQNIVDNCERMDYDGIDLDWEPRPSVVYQTDRVQPLINEIKNRAAQKIRYTAPYAPFIITFPGFPLNINQDTVRPADVATAALVDQYNLMTYNWNFSDPSWHSWFFMALKGAYAQAPTSIESSLQGYVAAGIPNSKLGIGLGLYCNGWKDPVYQMRQSYSGNPKWGSSDYGPTWAGQYSLGRYGNPYGVHIWDPVAETWYWSYYTGENPAFPEMRILTNESIEDIAQKGAYIRANGYGGTIIWTENYGYVGALGTNPPMQAVKNAFLG